jgi:hypothetical protein
LGRGLLVVGARVREGAVGIGTGGGEAALGRERERGAGEGIREKPLGYFFLDPR